jgi:hypothetical protein
LEHLSALEKRGLIKREHEPGRFTLAVRVEEAPADAVCEVALLGRIAYELSSRLGVIGNRQLEHIEITGAAQ